MSTPARDHDQWTDSLGAWLLGALPEDEAAGFQRHLAECDVCRHDAAALRIAADALPASAEPRTPPAPSRTARRRPAPAAPRGSAG